MKDPVELPVSRAETLLCTFGFPAVCGCTLLQYALSVVCALVFSMRALLIASLLGTAGLAVVALLMWQRQWTVSCLVFSLQSGIFVLLGPWIGTGVKTGSFLLPAAVLQILPYTSQILRAFLSSFLGGSFLFCTVFSILFDTHGPGQIADLLLSAGFLLCQTIATLIFCSRIVHRTLPKNTGSRYAMEKLRYDAYYDALTGLRNRRCGEKVLAELFREPDDMPWCVAMLDVDDFKSVNDTYGHLAGDCVLRHMAKTIRGRLRAQDYIFRWGGEEFLFLLQNTDVSQAAQILERIRGDLERRPVRSREQTIAFTVTIGVVELDPTDIDGSIDRCDHKMYRGKRRGKNTVVL